ncbi:hypothetical protein MetMK1DRAFT_00017190 [Metallosphaera yellowstonensis MK1]|uniref:Uncharacterized protein n=2 Tax=Metallosphaera TaxID=41980 RepID=H2C596_9CREN|nr:hypothetical protein MetMK1DRAFT_00017190 [Metallosphaera yellowstonensis MK1]
MNVLLEVHYHDREELGPLEPPVGVAVDPVVLRGSRPPGALWSTVSSTMTGPFTSPDRTSTRRRVLPTPPAGLRSPTRTSRPRSSRWPSVRTMRISANPTFLLLPFLLTTPRTWLISLTSLSLANSICPFPHLFSRKTSKNKNFSLIPTSWYYLPKIPITAVLN